MCSESTNSLLPHLSKYSKCLLRQQENLWSRSQHLSLSSLPRSFRVGISKVWQWLLQSGLSCLEMCNTSSGDRVTLHETRTPVLKTPHPRPPTPLHIPQTLDSTCPTQKTPQTPYDTPPQDGGCIPNTRDPTHELLVRSDTTRRWDRVLNLPLLSRRTQGII